MSTHTTFSPVAPSLRRTGGAGARPGACSRRQWCWSLLVGAGLLAWAAIAAVADDAPGRPVILLTGFQPFGEPRIPNISWEAIKDLQGREWGGYELRCLELPVEWGAPRRILEAWLREHRPAAVFSFGQGRPGTFAIEDVAHNRRGSGRDNNAAIAPAPEIVAGGPERFEASFDTRGLLRALNQRGYPIHLSTDAGAYLCEELLYTLEYLKSQGEIPGSVLFCHVPPLGSVLPDRRERVTPQYVQQFVLDVLACWQTPSPAEAAAAAPAAETRETPSLSPSAPPASPAQSPRQVAVERLIRQYFESWSNRDLDAYGRCFHPEATIHLLDESGKVRSFAKGPFVDWQRQLQRRSGPPMTEVPVTIRIQFEQEVARAEVYWKLTQGERVEVGYDHFTLIKQGERWLILHLLFYGVNPPR